MKKLLIVLITVMTLGTVNSTQAQIGPGISFNTFYNELSPYGRWINDPGYGQVWVASQQGFEPYYDNGHWVFTSYGWTWVSDYSWGWAPFHYGRWAFTSYGWAWVPGYEWAPAWVGWCQNDGYYGWAPLSPGLGFNIAFNNIPRDRWRFVQHQYINSPSVRNHFIRPDRNPTVYNNVTIINNTQVINNTTYAAGPQKESVEKATRKKIETKQLAFNETRQQTQVEKTQVKMYRPDTKANQAVSNTQPAQIKKEENAAAVPLKNTDKKEPAVSQQNQQPVLTDQQKAAQAEALRRQKLERLQQVEPDQPVQQQPVLTDQQKAAQAEALRRQKEERLQQVQPDKPVQQQPVQQKEIEKPQPVIQQNTERQDAVKQQKLLQQQEQMKQQQMVEKNQQQQKLQAQKEQQAAVQQQDLQKQNELQQQKLQAQKEQQAAAQQQDLQRQNELRQQKIQQQNQIRQQKMQDQKNQQQAAQEQRLQRQNERQQRTEQQQQQPQPQNTPQPVPERKPLQKTKTPL